MAVGAARPGDISFSRAQSSPRLRSVGAPRRRPARARAAARPWAAADGPGQAGGRGTCVTGPADALRAAPRRRRRRARARRDCRRFPYRRHDRRDRAARPGAPEARRHERQRRARAVRRARRVRCRRWCEGGATRTLLHALHGPQPQHRDELGRFVARGFDGGARQLPPPSPESHDALLGRILRAAVARRSGVDF